MKKNISINVGGIIFHIEEDGYENLKDYLSSINKYFSNYEDSIEIIADIESRIAEIFLSKLSENKQVITHEDVENLMATMGRVSDFEAAEEIIDETYSTTSNFYQEETNTDTKTVKKKLTKEYSDYKKTFEDKTFLRDEKRKLIGGVCSGIAHYFNIDALWVRMIFLLPFFDIFITFVAPWFVVAVYAIIWIAIPGSNELEEDEKLRRLFRDGENAVLGGVAAGVSSFFGIDVNIVRLLFVISTFTGGVGFILYLIIWFITPEAKSITERMQMKGEPITLSNIEKKIKDSLNFDEDEDESLIARILLFPFRLISKIIDSVGDDVGPIAKVLFTILSVFIGILLVMISMGITIGLVSSLTIFFGFADSIEVFVNETDVPIGMIQMIQNSFPPVGVFFTFISVWIPVIFIGILGSALIARKMVTKPILNWGLLGMWIIGLIGAGVTVPLFLTELQSSGTFKETFIYEAPNERLNITLEEENKIDDITMINLAISGHDKEEI
ncbi:MAG: PspC domain-containing protein, partial [Bacteroidota bacterium]